MNPSKYIKIALLILTFAALERSQLGTATISGVHPDLLLAATSLLAIFEGREAGAVIGFVFGLVADSFAAVPFGVSSLVYTVVGYTVGMAAETSLAESALLRTVVSAGANLGGVVLMYLVLQVLGISTVLDSRLPDASVVALVVGALATGLLGPLVGRLLRFGAEERPPSRKGARY